MKKILLIHPKSPETFWQLTGALSITKKKAVVPPLGLATLAAITPSHYEVEIIDEEIEDIDFDTPCDIVGITGYTLHAHRMHEIAHEFRKRGALIVGGGPYCTVHKDECKDHFDVLVCGEVEFIWPQFLSEWEKGEHKDYYIETNKISLEATPIPRWDLVKMEHYSGNMVQTSRGCPYDCEFCDVVALFGRKMRYKSYDRIIEEISIIEQMGRRDMFLADDNFIGNKRFVKELLQRLVEFNKTVKIPVRFMTQVTLNIAEDEDLLDLFKEANFYSFFIGIETPKKESLEATNKGHNARLDMVEAIRRIYSRGMFIVSGMIVGFDTDDISIFEMQRKFLKKTGLIIPMLGMLTAPKGTKLWDRLESEGRLIPNLETGDMFAETNFVPKLIKKEDLETNYLQLLQDVFRPTHFAETFKSMIAQVDVNKIKKDSSLARMMALSNFYPYALKVTFRLISHYLFSAGKAKRKLFFTVLKTAVKKSMLCFPLAIEGLLYFKALNDFVESHKIDYFEPSLIQQSKPTETISVNTLVSEEQLEGHFAQQANEKVVKH